MSVRRGRPSNRAHGAVFRETVLAIVRDKYTDFGPTLVKELRLAGVAGIDDGNACSRRLSRITTGASVSRRVATRMCIGR